MAEAVYVLCFLSSAAITFLLLRGYARSRQRILLWSGLGFAGLCLNNVMLVLDRMVVPQTDLSVARNIPTLLGVALVLFGFIWDAD